MKTLNSIKRGILVTLSVLLFVGCSNQDSSKTEMDVVEAQESAKPQTHIVEIKDMKFQPENLVVHNGDTVVWVNKDIVAHDVTEANKVWVSPSLTGESSWKKAITESAAYYCSVHVIMKGRLTVEE